SVFADVSTADQFCPAIHWLAAAGRSFQCNEQPVYGSTWCPNDAITRGSLAEILPRGLAPGDDAVPAAFSNPDTGRSYDCTDGKANAFSDVPDGSALCRYVYFLWANGVVDGFGDGTYRPSMAVPRDQMAKFLVNAYHLGLN
ncbi:MAG TPA: S-layer homology domain-containing protein, partial [Thermoanaerobaculia bacterium]|nr:S-layer homology domain-containing protein [Thermoanaerobaculia bacterium]